MMQYYRSVTKLTIANGTVHVVPLDLKKALIAAPKALAAWQSLTPLARNEWICWDITVKQQQTRNEHITRTISELQGGKRRPCCWSGCIHRKDKLLSPSVRWLLNRRKRI